MKKSGKPAPRGGSVKKNPTPAQIIAMRKAANITQEVAAEMVYATTRSWQDWEGGQRRMHAGLFELFEIKVAQMPLQEES